MCCSAPSMQELTHTLEWTRPHQSAITTTLTTCGELRLAWRADCRTIRNYVSPHGRYIPSSGFTLGTDATGTIAVPAECTSYVWQDSGSLQLNLEYVNPAVQFTESDQ